MAEEEEEEEEEEDENKRIRPRERALGQKIAVKNIECILRAVSVIQTRKYCTISWKQDGFEKGSFFLTGWYFKSFIKNSFSGC